MDNNFDEREYSTVSQNNRDTIPEVSNKIVLANNRKRGSGFSGKFVILIVIICVLCSSILGSLFTLYIAPNFSFSREHHFIVK